MAEINDQLNQRTQNTIAIKRFINERDIDLLGITTLRVGEKLPTGVSAFFEGFLKKYLYAIVMGIQMGKLGDNQTGKEASFFLERAAFDLSNKLVRDGNASLVIHTEDELDPVNRIGLFSLKTLAKQAGLGWQGRSLLIVSPQYGPLHRLIAVLTDLPLEVDSPIKNRCEQCSLCVSHCPTGALTLVDFNDHPATREEVLNVDRCLGDGGCQVCIDACPFLSGLNYS